MSFRVTERMTFNLMNRGIGQAGQMLQDAQRKAVTGLRVERPSDDPVAASRGMAVQSALRQMDGMDRAGNMARTELEMREASLSTVTERVGRVRELITQSLNAVVTSSDRALIAAEISEIREEVLSVANRQVNNNYIFAGYNTRTEPFLADGTYTGDSGVRQSEVAPGILIDVNAPGNDVFNPAGGVDMFTWLSNLETALNNDDEAAINVEFAQLTAVEQQVTVAQSTAGVQLASLEKAEENREDLKLDLQSSVADILEADQVEALTELAQAQSAYESAIAQAGALLRTLSNSVG